MQQTDLRGLTVLNTRPRDQAESLNRQIILAGGQTINFPCIEIESNGTAWLNRLTELQTADQAIFISANAAQHCFSILAKQNIDWPDHIRVTAIGKSTAITLKQHKIRVDAIPETADSEHLLSLASFQQIEGQTVLLFKGEGGLDIISKGLKQRGANLIELDVYRRSMPTVSQKQVDDWWQDGHVDIILITSQQAIKNLFTMTGSRDVSRLQRIPCLCISARIAELASHLGMKTVIVSQVEKILDTLHQFKKGTDHDHQEQ